MRVAVRSKEELDLMRKSGEITASALKKAIEAARVGVNLLEIEKIAEEEMARLGGGSSFKTVEGYFWSTCLTVNDEVVHGVPRDYILKKGDVLGIDLGAVYKGWHTDTAWSVLVGAEDSEDQTEKGLQVKEDVSVEEKKRFLRVGEEALWKAISQAVEGNQIGDISHAIQSTVEPAGYSVVRALVGHGVGRQPHEEPEIPGVGRAKTGLKLKEGMTLAIEAIYNMGGYEVYQKEDGWTIAADDGSLGGLFEMTVIVGKEKPEVLTDWRRA